MKDIRITGSERIADDDQSDHSQPTITELIKAMEDQDFIMIIPIEGGDFDNGKNESV